MNRKNARRKNTKPNFLCRLHGLVKFIEWLSVMYSIFTQFFIWRFDNEANNFTTELSAGERGGYGGRMDGDGKCAGGGAVYGGNSELVMV